MTRKSCSIIFTIGWMAAFTFGWIALGAPPDEPDGLRMLNMTLAALGAGSGIWAWMRIKRDC